MGRPETLVLVVGTATEIGKTWVGGQALTSLRQRGVTVAARKPAQSLVPADVDASGRPIPTDAEVLAAASGEQPAEVCPAHRTYPVPLAPPMAADVLGLAPPTLDELLGELAWPDPAPAIGWLETVGGPRSPIGSDGDAVDLFDRLAPDEVVLVADAGLGTINAVVLSVAPFRESGRDQLPIVILNRYDGAVDLHRRNLEWLRTREGLEVVTDPEALALRLVGR